MHDAFVPLAAYLRSSEPAPVAPAEEERDEPAAIADVQRDTPAGDELAEIRRFRAAIADALDLHLDRLLTGIAAGVLARELRIAPADLQAIVARELAQTGEPPVRIRANPNDCASLAAWDGVVVADATLRGGDVAIDLRSGTILATLGCRLERVLAASLA
jgi:flagellar biosynthesis/type III secretory pathway protein FliH